MSRMVCNEVAQSLQSLNLVAFPIGNWSNSTFKVRKGVLLIGVWPEFCASFHLFADVTKLKTEESLIGLNQSDKLTASKTTCVNVECRD